MSRIKIYYVFLLLIAAIIILVGCNKEDAETLEVGSAQNQVIEELDSSNSDGLDQQDPVNDDEKAVESEEYKLIEAVEEAEALDELEAVDEPEEAEEAEEALDINTEQIEEALENQKNIAYILDKLSVRAESSLESKSLGKLTRGKEVQVLEELIVDDTTWYKIQYEQEENNNEGWILSENTTKDINELHSSPGLFEDQVLNDYFTSPTLFEENTIVAYYGHPYSDVMGIVGRHSKEDLITLLKETAETYDAVNGDQGVVPAIYLIYGTVQPKGEIYSMPFELVMSYIETAYLNGVLVYLDHQIGKYTPLEALNEILHFLRYPNVQLALDPEWRTNKPMEVVGYLTGSELNGIQETMNAYMTSNNLQGKRQFVFHQFLEKMIQDIETATSDYESILLVHNTSGWGSPSAKIATHTRNAEVTNIPYKGFKLWYYYSDLPGVHYDNPIMTPEQVLELEPQPGLVIYQ